MSLSNTRILVQSCMCNHLPGYCYIMHDCAIVSSGAYEPPEGRKERPTLHYSVERHLILNAINTSLIWTYPQVVMSGVESVANAHRVYVYSTLQQLRVQARVRRRASSSLDVFTASWLAAFDSLSCSIP